MASLTARAQAVHEEAEHSRLRSVSVRMRIRRRRREVEQLRADCMQTLELARIRRAWLADLHRLEELPWRTVRDIDDVLEVVDS